MARSRSAMARRLPWIALFVVAAIALFIGAEVGQSRSFDDEVAAVAATIKCPRCAGQSVATSESSSAVAIRNDIAERLERGQTPDQIRDYYAYTFDESILLNPPRSGVGRVVWVLPVVVLAATFGGLGLAFARWRREEDAEASDADRAMVAAAREGAVDPTDTHGEGAGR